jgi:Class-II DAHP synthetase family
MLNERQSHFFNQFVKKQQLRCVNGAETHTVNMSNSNWSIDSWKSKPVLQDVVYDDQAHLETVLKKLQHLPPMVTPSEVNIPLNPNVLVLLRDPAHSCG